MFAKRSDAYHGLPFAANVELARMALNDTLYGGCAAMVMAKGNAQAESIVSDVYTSNGVIPAPLDAWGCKECGCVHYGKDAAEKCCSEFEDTDADWSDADIDYAYERYTQR